MLKIDFLNSHAYKFGALCFWFLSYFLFTNSQYVINLNYFFLLLPTLLTIRFAELKDYSSHKIVWLLAAYLITTIAAAFHSGSPSSQAVYCFVVFLFYLTIYRLPPINNQQENKLAWAWFSVVLLYAVYNLVIAWHAGTWHFGERLGSFFAFIDNPIYVADLLTIGLAMISFNALRNGKFAQLCVAHVITLFMGLVILQSRSMLPVWLVICLLTLATGLFQTRYSQSKRHLLWLTLPAIILFYILSSKTGSTILARADSYRFEIWQAYINQTIQCGVWLGCGIKDGIHYVTQNGNPITHAHNIFVSNFAKTGLLGTFLLLSMLMSAIFYGLKKNHMAGWILIAGTTAMLFDGSSLIKSPNERWILIHLPLAYLIKKMVEEKLDRVREAN
ncbi:MAG: hypothetical protein CTY37_03985 [Methylotenera sp.]|nr:MAG: hypothetical protein CTY37_03985 [Methylotenera sp.]